jgi:hypothetical protein
MMTWEEQLMLSNANAASGFREAAQRLNSVVTPCPEPDKRWWEFWVRRHRFEDYTSALNTFTYTTAKRCRNCGLVELGSGL